MLAARRTARDDPGSSMPSPDTATNRPLLPAAANALTGLLARHDASVATRRSRRVLPLLCSLTLAAGCAPRIDLSHMTEKAQRMTYEALRREDCRLNQIDEFCQRTFANEYVEYDRLRRRFIRESTEGVWRASDAGEDS